MHGPTHWRLVPGNIMDREFNALTRLSDALFISLVWVVAHVSIPVLALRERFERQRERARREEARAAKGTGHVGSGQSFTVRNG
jgi:hypothetical protein